MSAIPLTRVFVFTDKTYPPKPGLRELFTCVKRRKITSWVESVLTLSSQWEVGARLESFSGLKGDRYLGETDMDR